MKIQQKFLGGVLFFALLGLAACGGGSSSSSDSGNSSTTVSGKLNSISASQSPSLGMSMRENISLEGLSVVGTDETGATVTGTTDAQGAFSLDLPAGHTYVVSFFEGQTYLGTLAFSIDQSGSFDTTAFRLNAGVDALALGNISCSAGSCVGDVNPLCSLDRDDDGEVDCRDADDDNDGIEDKDENDRDHDGIEDDLEDHHHDGEDDVASDDCEVIRSRPYQGEQGVDQNEEIRVRFSNALDTSTVTSESLYLTDASGLIAVAYSFENEEEHGEVRLDPSAGLAPLTEYTLHVTSSVQCSNGRSPAQNLEIVFSTDNDDSQQSGSEDSGHH